MQDFLNKFLSFFRGGNGALGVDFGSSAIKVVQLKKSKGHAVLETYGELSVGPYGSGDVGSAVKLPSYKMTEALTDVLRESKVSSRACGMAIPISSSLVTTIELPLVDDKQFAQMVPIEARKYIPVPITEVALDWWVIPKEVSSVSAPFKADSATIGDIKSGHMVDVLLAVIHNDAIHHYQDIAHSVGLSTSFYEVEIFSTIRSALGREERPVMILDMGAATTKLYIIDRGIIRGSHIINRGSQDVTQSLARGLNLPMKEAELAKRNLGLEITNDKRDIYDLSTTTLSYILSEANRMVFNYEKRTGVNVGRIILTGGGVLLKDFLPYAQNFFETEAVLADPFSKVEAPAFLEPVLKRRGPEFAVAIGLALRKLQENS